MKRIIALFLAMMMVFLTLTACGDAGVDTDKPNDTEVSEAGTSEPKKEEDKTEAEDKTEEKDPYQELGFKGIDVSTSGTVKKDAPSVISSEISLFGKSYVMPFQLSDLTSDGWTTQIYDVTKETVPANTEMDYEIFVHGIHMNKNSIDYLKIQKLLNSGNTEAVINDCTLVSFVIYNRSGAEFVLPGGITQDSTVRDILDVYGTPDDCEAFSGSTVFDNKLQYGANVGSGLFYTFEFKENGSISSVRIEKH